MNKILKVVIFLLAHIFTYLPTIGQDTFIPATDKNINYMGRIDFSNDSYPSYSYPGVTISTKFKGTCIKAIIKDFASGGSETTNYYNVVIDDEILYKIEVNRQDTLYTLAIGLEDTEHTIALVKRTESSVGKSSFGGFMIEGNSLLANTLPTLKMEFIGDSWTAGYGNEISTTSPNTGFHSINEDNYRAWGYTLAKRFNAQYHGTAISGRGISRNNTGSETGLLSEEFYNIHLGNTKWDFTNYIPDIVFIHLGTNDFYLETVPNPTALDSAKYVTAYIDFIKDVRKNYGNDTKIVCVFGNSKSDFWPEGKQHLTRWRNYIDAIVKNFEEEGDNNVYQFEQATQQSPYGEDWHPSLLTHNKMATEISPFVADLLGITSNDYLPNTQAINVIDETALGLTASFAHQILPAYPNPCDDITIISGIDADETWRVMNVTGKVEKMGKGNQIDMGSLATGVYFVLTKKSISRIMKK